ncbi:uncharacterized protein C8Q71DRAFT_281687 [Rhodofomes roseus]|uniref:Uncharacterized protein n=1 Tax=Rhodofomes roseus TaxID=34475 RepID=A0ABQ8K552_9APHY|nr:uncharacterized protein C8Q71DRAFT_281687 [Rhodofomes roseus]KAH9832097.1 hypothetical protein C8Q71DRAFT_281687 [Rhodofomes roseus]
MPPPDLFLTVSPPAALLAVDIHISSLYASSYSIASLLSPSLGYLVWTPASIAPGAIHIIVMAPLH